MNKRTAPMDSEMQLCVTEEDLELFPEPHTETLQKETQKKRPIEPVEKILFKGDTKETHTAPKKEIPSLLSLKGTPVGALVYATKRHGFRRIRRTDLPGEQKTL